MSIQTISSTELSRFLNDIELNISDKATDFKKIILYLFKFTNEKLSIIQSEKYQDDDLDLLNKLVKIIELVLSKNSYLLNLPLSKEKIIDNYKDTILYEWVLMNYINKIPHYQNILINQIKSLIINVINLIVNLNNYKFVLKLRKLLLGELETNLNECFNRRDEKKLVKTIHLFTIVNDYEISKKLSLLNSLKFENINRRLWFLCDDEELKSILFLNNLYNLELNPTWSQISLLQNWVSETVCKNSPNLNHATSLALLKMYKICIEKDITLNFNYKSDSPLVMKSLNVIKCHMNNTEHNEPFTDFELESLRLDLFPKPNKPHDLYSKITSLREEFKLFDEKQEIDPNRPPTNFDFTPFLNITNPLLLTNLLLLMYNVFATYLPQQDKLDFLLHHLATNDNRDVRMLITRILPLYLIRNDDPDDIFKYIFQKVTAIDFSKKRHFGESTIKTLVNLAIVSRGERLCAVYFKLVDWLGEANDQHVNYVYCGFLDIAYEKSLPPYKLLSSYLPSIAEIIIKKPRVFERVLQISNIQRNFFLNRTKDYTVPKLLEYYKAPLIQQIAVAANVTTKKLLANHLPRILATYLGKGLNEKYIIKVLSSVDPHYKSIGPNDLFTHIGDIIWYILLENKDVNYALSVVKKHTNSQIDDQVLLLVQKFSDVTLSRSAKPYLEKISSFNAMRYLIETHANAIVSALGQLSTCLQATLEEPDFHVLSLKCWYDLVKNVPSTHLISLIDIIISIIFQKFQQFGQEAKMIAIDILKVIYQTIQKNEFINYSLYYLSLPFLTFMDDYNLVQEFKIKPLSKKAIFHEFNRRLQTSNEYIVKQALFDLFNYCQQYQVNCQEAFKEISLSESITNLVRTILDLASKFKNTISTECARVLAIIGSLDSNKFNFKTVKKSIVVRDFKNNQEVSEFLIDLIENYVVKIFWSSNDPHKQLFAAYALQSFLKILDLDLNRFSDVAKSTLTPLLTSKYAASKPKIEPLEYPYFRLGMRYETWLVDITLDLLKRASYSQDPQTENLIYQTCCILIQKQRDVALCEHLLKYVCLSQINDEAILIEFQYIFSLDYKNLSSDKSEVLKSTFQTVFSVFDYLNELGADEFLSHFPMDLIAIKSAEFDCYERTILYIEKCFRNGQIVDNKLGDLDVSTTLQSMYAGINDFDALNGVLQVFSTTNLKEKLSTFQYNDNWTLAHETFHVLNAPEKLLKSLNEHGLYDEVLSTLPNEKCIPLEWSIIGLRSAVYTGNATELNKWLSVTDSIGKPQDLESLVDYQLAKSLKYLLDGDSKFKQSIDNLYNIIGSSLVNSTSSSFSRNVTLMNQLHSIHDLNLIMNGDQEVLKLRLSNISQDFNTQRKILTIHNVANKVLGRETLISENLVYEAGLARENKRLDIANKAIVQAMKLDNKMALFEHSKLLFFEGKQAEAIRSIDELRHDIKTVEIQLQYTNWLNETNHVSAQQIIKEYNKAIELNDKYEKAYYDLGKYYDKLLESSPLDKRGIYEQLMIRNFIRCVSVGNSFIFESLPKIVSTWLNFADAGNKSSTAQNNLKQIIQDMRVGAKSIPTYSWYTVLTLLLNKVVHPHEESFKILAKIIANVAKTYPKQALWFLLHNLYSTMTQRVKRVQSILKHNSTIAFNNQVVGAQDLFNILISIASKSITKSSKNKCLSLYNFFKIDLDKSFDELVIPTNSQMNIIIPQSNLNNFNFFESSVTFSGFMDKVDVFFSLQMPRKIGIKGSDGSSYYIMLKADNVTNDSEVMNMFSIINRLLMSNFGSKSRNLIIKCYQVLSIAPNIGVIEYLTEVNTIKSIITQQFRKNKIEFNERKIFMKLDQHQKFIKEKKFSEENLTSLIKTFSSITNKFPLVLGDHLMNSHKDVKTWLVARNNFTMTNGVMSMAGHIIGLGDRHLENILVNSNGFAINIDFDCIFDKGLSLPTPEIVPFRLTRNIVDAFGITGVEGCYRSTAEITLSIMRNNIDSILNSFQIANKDQIATMGKKLKGLNEEGLSMSVHGQVDALIQEATAVENLAQMYGGWAAYL